MQTEYKILEKAKAVLFTVGHIGPGMLNQFITMNLIFYFTETLTVNAVSGATIGLIILLGRIMDGVADPLVASWSDNLSNKKYGRRLPFIALGSIPMILCFIAIWITPLIDSAFLRIALLGFAINGFYFFYTVVVNPYFALLPDVSTKKTRSFMQSFIALFGILGMGIALGTSGLIFSQTGSMIVTSLIFGVFAFIVLLAPILTLKVNPDYEYKEKKKFNLNTLLENIKSTLKVKEFSAYLLGFAMFFFGFQLIQYALLHIVTILYNLDRGIQGTAFIVSVVSALLFIPLVNFIIKKTSIETMLKISLLSFAVVALLMGICGILNLSNTVVIYGIMLALGFPYSGLMMVPNLIVSKIIDNEHSKTKNKNEAMFFGTQGLINKVTLALAGFTVGVIVDVNSGVSGISFIVFLAALFSLVGFFYLRKYSIDG